MTMMGFVGSILIAGGMFSYLMAWIAGRVEHPASTPSEWATGGTAMLALGVAILAISGFRLN